MERALLSFKRLFTKNTADDHSSGAHTLNHLISFTNIPYPKGACCQGTLTNDIK
jgi:hypothetical protein